MGGREPWRFEAFRFAPETATFKRIGRIDHLGNDTSNPSSPASLSAMRNEKLLSAPH